MKTSRCFRVEVALLDKKKINCFSFFKAKLFYSAHKILRHGFVEPEDWHINHGRARGARPVYGRGWVFKGG